MLLFEERKTLLLFLTRILVARRCLRIKKKQIRATSTKIKIQMPMIAGVGRADEEEVGELPSEFWVEGGGGGEETEEEDDVDDGGFPAEVWAEVGFEFELDEVVVVGFPLVADATEEDEGNGDAFC